MLFIVVCLLLLLLAGLKEKLCEYLGFYSKRVHLSRKTLAAHHKKRARIHTYILYGSFVSVLHLFLSLFLETIIKIVKVFI